jgi:hypothetical protein
MFVIYDELHAEHVAEFATREAALAELRRLASLSWDQAPNMAPCTSWQTCGRQYELVEFDDTSTPWRTLSHIPALDVSRAEVKWLSGLMSD